MSPHHLNLRCSDSLLHLLHAAAEHQRVHSMLPLMDRKKWERYGCSEFAAPVGHQLPKVGVAHCSQDSSSAADRGHCPPRGRRAPSLLILGYQNGPSPWLCSFLQTLGHHGVSATILGWEPLGGVKRHRRDYYFADKIYSMLRFLLTCQLPGAECALLVGQCSDMSL